MIIIYVIVYCASTVMVSKFVVLSSLVTQCLLTLTVQVHMR